MDGSGPAAPEGNIVIQIPYSPTVPCMQMAGLTLHPNEVESAREGRPRGAKRREKAETRETRGRSSATTTQERRLKRGDGIDEMRENVHLIDSIIVDEDSIMDILTDHRYWRSILKYSRNLNPPRKKYYVPSEIDSSLFEKGQVTREFFHALFEDTVRDERVTG